jgi:hypothetical protein
VRTGVVSPGRQAVSIAARRLVREERERLPDVPRCRCHPRRKGRQAARPTIGHESGKRRHPVSGDQATFRTSSWRSGPRSTASREYEGSWSGGPAPRAVVVLGFGQWLDGPGAATQDPGAATRRGGGSATRRGVPLLPVPARAISTSCSTRWPRSRAASRRRLGVVSPRSMACAAARMTCSGASPASATSAMVRAGPVSRIPPLTTTSEPSSGRAPRLRAGRGGTRSCDDRRMKPHLPCPRLTP